MLLSLLVFLQEKGYDVDLIVPESNITLYEFIGHKFNVIALNKGDIVCQYDIIVATLYSTLFTDSRNTIPFCLF